MEKVLISGGSGLIGTRLTKLLIEEGYEVAHLSRKKSNKGFVKSYFWDIDKQEIESGALENCDYLIHLAGEPIVDKRWTENRKRIILESRSKTAGLLFKEVSKLTKKPKAILSASAVGYYGFATDNKIFVEEDKEGDDFSAKTCKVWEASVAPFEQYMRTVIIRIGIVLSTKGGALPLIALPIRLGVGSALGSGNQIVPWIHEEDLCSIFLHALKNDEINGTYNAVAPGLLKQSELTKAIARQLHRPLFFPKVPGFLLELILGERAEIVLKGNAISCAKLQQTGYNFKYSQISSALLNLYGESGSNNS